MADAPLTLMTVHAHPDDESIGTGGILARYAAEGVQTVLVTCTRGELGEIADPSLATPENLGEVREAELHAAADLLNVSALHLLEYRDSGMMGTPPNDDPRSFWRADMDAATGRVVALIRRYRPQVLVTYDENGFYGHPDHIQANRVTVAAFHAAGDPERYPESGLAPWAPQKLYYQTVPRSRMREFDHRLRELKLVPENFDQAMETEWGIADELVTTTVDVLAFAGVKRQALGLHRSQIGPDHFMLRLPPDLWTEWFGTEHYQRIACSVPAPEREDDLFVGLRDS